MTPSTVDVVADGAAAAHMIRIARIGNRAFPEKVDTGFSSGNATKHSGENRKSSMRLLPKFQAPICRSDDTQEARL